MKLSVSFIEAQNVGTQKHLVCTDEIVQKAADALSQKIALKLLECFDLSKSANADFLLLSDLMYRKNGRTTPEDILQQMEFNVNVKVGVRTNG